MSLVAVLGHPQGAEPAGAAAQRVPCSAGAGGQQAAVRPAVEHRAQLPPAGGGLDERWVLSHLGFVHALLLLVGFPYQINVAFVLLLVSWLCFSLFWSNTTNKNHY